MTSVYAEVIGDPIAHSKSPLIHNFWLAKLGIDAEYRAVRVEPSALKSYLDSRNADDLWRGCNVTLPHKRTIMPMLDRIDPKAAEVGAVNTVVMSDYYLEGYNSDRPGFLEPLKPMLANEPTSRFAYLIGSGGAALAIGRGLVRDAGFTLILYNRDPAKAWPRFGDLVWDDDLNCGLDSLSGTAEPNCDWRESPDRLDVIVNATSLGMDGQPPLLINLDRFPKHAVVYDIVYSPLETPLLKTARARGMRTVDGQQMLIGQAAVAFERFFGQRAPRQYDAELRALLLA